MNAIIGLTNMALHQVEDPVFHEQLSKINQASLHLLHVINDILDLSKIEAEYLTLEQVEFKLGDVVEDLMPLISNKAQEKGIEIRIELPVELAQISVIGDPIRLGQVLLNLAGNSLKFTESGSITLRSRLIENSSTKVQLHWEVQDTGIGISANDQQRLFTAFEQADGSMTRKYGGTGLGLAICKRLVQMMNGDIGVESSVGQGSTFWFTVSLPKAMLSNDNETRLESATFDSAEDKLKQEFAGAQILLAEDEPINQEVSKYLLEEVGLKVDLADDGVIALQLARKNHYALILMDMQMPNLNGLDATREIRGDSLNRETAILAMTANAFDEDRQVCIDAGMNDHIAKPVDPMVLYATLLKWLTKQHHHNPN